MKRYSLLVPALMLSVLSGCTMFGQSTDTTQAPEVDEPATTPVVTQPEVKPETPTVKETEVTKPTETKPEPKPEKKPVTKPKPKPEVKPAKVTETPEGKLILGSKEWVYLSELKVNSLARVDTGATTSSISAIDVVNFERDGKDWVKFKLSHDQGTSKEISLPVKSKTKIRQASSEKLVTRYEVEAWIQVGKLKVKTPFTLADRTHMDYGVLLGRTFFRDVAVVDVSRQLVQPKITAATAK